ncbi:MAG TPA: hypothetical protein VJH22_03265 [Candidatus Nanoarchaeia archaeon]|nr:hypothetical protein [Candidatus Nanoarchaeia archaeon]
MKLIIYPPRFKDLPTVELDLPADLVHKDLQILYGYTQPSKPYDRTLFIHLVAPEATTKAHLKKLAGQLRDLIRRNWVKNNYEIVHIEEDYRSNQAFIYFQLKRKENSVVSPRLLSTPLPKVTPPSEPALRKKLRSKRVVARSRVPRKHQRSAKSRSKR